MRCICRKNDGISKFMQIRRPYRGCKAANPCGQVAGAEKELGLRYSRETKVQRTHLLHAVLDPLFDLGRLLEDELILGRSGRRRWAFHRPSLAVCNDGRRPQAEFEPTHIDLPRMEREMRVGLSGHSASTHVESTAGRRQLRRERPGVPPTSRDGK